MRLLSERRGRFFAAFIPPCREDTPITGRGPTGASKFISAHAVAVDKEGMRKKARKPL